MTIEQRTSLLLQRIVGAGISASTAQRQGPPGTMNAAAHFLFSPNLIAAFNEAESKAAFISVLDTQTEELRNALPSGVNKGGNAYGQHWGSARKFLNIFLFDCVLNRYICDIYKNLSILESWLEVPLDSYVGQGLTSEKENGDYSFALEWNTIIGLKKQASDRYQELAQQVADRMRIPRVHLDLYYLAYEKPVL